MIRRCRAVTKLGPGGLQSWAGDIITVLREAHQAVEDARARGSTAPDADMLDKLRQRYDEAAASGIIHNRLLHSPENPGCHHYPPWRDQFTAPPEWTPQRGWKTVIDQEKQKFSIKCRKGASIGYAHEETAMPPSLGRQERRQAPAAFLAAR